MEPNARWQEPEDHHPGEAARSGHRRFSPAYVGSLISQRALEYALGLPEAATEKDSASYGCDSRSSCFHSAQSRGRSHTSLNTRNMRRVSARLLAAAQARVDKAASSNTPDEIKDEAIIRMVGYLFDRPHWSESGNGQASAYHHSGAAALLAPWRKKRALHIGD